jgi:hypothetical protein
MVVVHLRGLLPPWGVVRSSLGAATADGCGLCTAKGAARSAACSPLRQEPRARRLELPAGGCVDCAWIPSTKQRGKNTEPGKRFTERDSKPGQIDSLLDVKFCVFF